MGTTAAKTIHFDKGESWQQWAPLPFIERFFLLIHKHCHINAMKCHGSESNDILAKPEGKYDDFVLLREDYIKVLQDLREI